MKRVWKLISREMKREGLTAKQMASRLRIDPAHLSRLRNGQLRDLSPETFGSLLAGFRKSPDLHSELLTAYLSDKLEGNGRIQLHFVRDAVSELQIGEAAQPYGMDLPAAVTETCVGAGLNRRVAEALGALAIQARANRRLQALLISLAEFSREEPDPVE
jgi:transcriptional regulator with XRE-family HTH domain